ncbi:MAG: hypothetical protein ACXW31_08860 [Thermoanaerobaculia bacterium]
MDQNLALGGVVRNFAADLRMWRDVIGADATVRETEGCPEARARLDVLATIVSERSRDVMAGVPRSGANVQRYATMAEAIAAMLPDGRCRNAIEEISARFRNEVGSGGH